MYAVIFRAELNELDEEYSVTASRMRELAFSQYSCTEIVSSTENNREITISYWDNLQLIKNWKADPEHLLAQSMGKEKWYKSYSVQIVEVLREYG
jgi:heme-degrading monooxygenase HmoA